MPIYEFYCVDCHTVFSFLSKAVNTEKRPLCPRCGKRKLDRQVSSFATPSRRAGGGAEGDDDLPIDEAKMERAVETLASEAEGINEDDPKQAARLMRKFSNMTGMEFGEGMENALSRLEAGEDPEKIEAEMGDLSEDEEPFVLPGDKGGKARKGRRPRPLRRDNTLYEL